MDKLTLRKRALEERNALPKDVKQTYDQAIYQRVIPYLKNQVCVAIYYSFQSEVDTHALLQYCFEHQIAVCAPKIENQTMHFYSVSGFEDFVQGHLGVMEPKTDKQVLPHTISLFLVPLLAYNTQGYRVGYGKGYYDRYLALSPHALTLGMAYSIQKTEVIFQEEYDVALDYIITEQGIFHHTI